MEKTLIVSEISCKDYEHAARAIVWHDPKYILRFSVLALLTLFWLFMMVYQLLNEGKLSIFDLIMSVLFLGTFVNFSFLYLHRALKKRRKFLLSETGTDTSVTDMYFMENCIEKVDIKKAMYVEHPYSNIECLYVFPDLVVISDDKGGIFIARGDIPDYEKLKSFLLEKKPNIKEKLLK